MSSLCESPPRVKAKAPKAKPARTMRWLLAPEPGRPYGVLQVTETVGRKTFTDVYFVTSVPADYGQAALVTKMEREKGATAAYHVNLGEADHGPTCECKGWLHHGHCRHVDALSTLRDRNRLFPAERPTPGSKAPRCTVCRTAPVAAEEGWDTCAECLAAK
jgi:hypothetical protein